MGKMGPMFKCKAKVVAEALKGLPQEALEKEEIKVSLDGEEFAVPRELVEFVQETIKVSGENIVPHVIEPSFGIDRILYSVMEHAYDEEMVPAKDTTDDTEDEARIVLRFKKEISPVKVAVLPLLTRQELIGPSKEIAARLREKGLLVAYDDSGTIGRRYRRNDEIGTPYCITIDYDTLEDGTVTIRDRDNMQQVRAPVGTIDDVLYELVYRDKKFETAGKPL